MLAELFDRLKSSAESRRKAHFEEHPQITREVLLVHGDDLEWVPIPPPGRKGFVTTYSSLVQAAKDSEMVNNPEVWHSEDGVCLVLERSDRRERVWMPLPVSQRWTYLSGLASGRAMSPADAVRFLRFNLYGPSTERLLQALRKVDFTRKSSGARTVEHGRESLGRAVEAEVQQADQVPEVFEVVVPVTNVPGCVSMSTVSVTVGVHLDPTAETVEFRVLADQLEQGQLTFHSALHAQLVDDLDPVPVFQGSP